MPTFSEASCPQQHVLINLDETLGSTTIVLDQATGELVESTAYLDATNRFQELSVNSTRSKRIPEACREIYIVASRMQRLVVKST